MAARTEGLALSVLVGEMVIQLEMDMEEAEWSKRVKLDVTG